MRDKTIRTIEEVIEPLLGKAGEIRTYEIWYICKKQKIDISYKTVGDALREIMEKQVKLGFADKIRLGCWRIKRVDQIHKFYNHPVDEEEKIQQNKEITDKCESVRKQIKGKNLELLLDLCPAHGISLKTFFDYVNKIKSA